MATNSIIINVDVGETRVAGIEEGLLSELYVERSSDKSPVGNIYVGKVTRVLPGMQAAFIDIGLDRAAFLHVEDVIPVADFEQMFSAEEDGDEEGDDNKPNLRLTRKTPIRDVLKEGQTIVVQVSKGPISTKGARVTSHISLQGRYTVYMPTVEQLGVSKRLGTDRERKRLKEVIEALKPPQGGVMVRAMSSNMTKASLKNDITQSVKIWETITQEQRKNKKAPVLLHAELDIILRTARDLFTEKVDKMVIDDPEEFERLKGYTDMFMPERSKDIELYSGSEPIFDEYGIEEEITRSLARKVPLPSGGYLIIDQAEALTAIDINTGRFTGRGQDVEETIFQTNIEAAREIAYQLRFRNIGGLIVLDFIDMERSQHREAVYKELLGKLKKDKAKTTVVRISELGLVEMTRKRTRESLGRTIYEPCFYCDGTAHLQSKVAICHEILRQIRREKDYLPGFKVVVNAHPAICDTLAREEHEAMQTASRRYARQIALQPRKDYHLEQFDLSGQ